MISTLLKHPVHFKGYQFFKSAQYTTNNINFSETTRISQMISTLLKHPVHFKGYQFFKSAQYTTNNINFSETPSVSHIISTFWDTQFILGAQINWNLWLYSLKRTFNQCSVNRNLCFLFLEIDTLFYMFYFLEFFSLYHH